MSGYDNKNLTTRISAATANTIVETDFVLLLQVLTGATAVTLPAPTANNVGRVFVIQKDASAQTVTITPASGLVDAGANTTLATGAVHCKHFVCDGTGWWTVAAF